MLIDVAKKKKKKRKEKRVSKGSIFFTIELTFPKADKPKQRNILFFFVVVFVFVLFCFVSSLTIDFFYIKL